MPLKKLILIPLVILLTLGLASMGFAASLSPPVQDGPNPPPESPFFDRSPAADRSGGAEAAQPIDYNSPADFSEGFDDINNLPGWYMQNNSDPLGLTNWFQGNSGVFPAHSGDPTSYIAANFNNTSGVGTISNWLLTPELALKNGDAFSFWTRTATGSTWPDRLQVRLSTAGASTNVGTAAEDVGDFTTLLLEINPDLVVGGYPEVWTQYILTLSGIPQGVTGRIAFRYYVTNGGPSGSNSNYIGIDTVEYIQAPSNPAITLSKTVGTDPMVCAATDEITVPNGSEVTYCFSVENTGDVTLNLHTLEDSALGTIFQGLAYSLDPGASAFITETVTIFATTVNTATWTAFNQLTYLVDDTIPYNFEDISATGTPFTLGDDAVSGPLPLGFTFRYYNLDYTDIYASSNGFLTVLPLQSSGCCSGQPIPSEANPNGVIAGWWEDLNPSAGGNLYYQTLGSAPNRRFIVQYTNIPHYPSGNLVTLQYKLFEGSNRIEVHYTAAPSDGGTHSAGIENETGTQGVQYYRGTASLPTNLAVRYTPQGGESASASDTALVNVLQPVLTVDPGALSSLQSPDSIVTKSLTIGNAGDPLTTLYWEIQEGEATVRLDSSTPRSSVISAPAAEVVGDEAQDKDASLPSAIGRASVPFAPTDILWDNGPLVTHPGGGFNGADASALQTALGMSTYGFGNQVLAGNRVADDFTIADPAGWQIDTITFFGYQTGSGTISTFTAVNLRIWDGPPDNPASNVVFGDTTTNRLINSTWSNIYRVLDTNLTNTDRPVMANTVSVGVSLPPGTYWLDWQADGTLTSGPWAPPISILGQTTTGNALQYLSSSDAWAPVTDVGPQGFPFIIEGRISPCGVDLPWVSVNLITGSLPGGETAAVDVVFDSTGLAKGVYSGILCVLSNDPLNPLVTLPLTMTVEDLAYLEVAHLAPFAADPGTSVTVTVDGAPVLTGFEYGDSTGYIPLIAGEHLVEIYPAGSPDPAITATLDLAVDTYSTAIAVGGANGAPLDLLLLEDDLSPPAAGNFKLRLGHLAPFAAGAGSLADVRLQDGTVILNDVLFGAVAPYLELPAGVYDLKITTPDGALTLIDPLPVTLAAGDNLAAFATGDGVNQPLGVFAYPAGVPGFFLPLATYGVELNPAAAAQSGAPGETVIYTLQVTNTSDVADAYTVSFSGNAWAVNVVDPSFELGAGESAQVEVQVTIPANAEDGDMDVVTVQVSGTGGQTASSVLTTTAVISQRKVFLPVIPQLYLAP